jgi:acetyl esterase/lipase
MTAEQFREAAKDPQRCPGPNGTGMRLKEINQVAKYPTVQAFLDSYENAWDRLPEAAAAGNLPRMYVCCGTKDKNVYPRYLRFCDYLKRLGVEATVEQYEGYRHEYPLWDIAIRRAMDFFGLEELPESKH